MKIRTRMVAAFGLAAGIVVSMSGAVWSIEKPQPVTKEQMIEELKSLLKNTPIMEQRESPVPGLFEIATGDQIFFYSPKGVLFFGEMYDKNGKNLTAARKEELSKDPRVIEFKKQKAEAQVRKISDQERVQAELLKKLPLDKATKIGNGPIKVVEFTDPDCPYCKKIEKEVLAGRNDITRYVFFFPLRQMHPQAANKAAFILSQPESDRAKAYDDIFAGKYDTQGVPSFTLEAQKRVTEQEEVAQKLGINGVPAFYIDNTFVSGADTEKIKQLLANAGKKGVQGSK